MCVRTAVLDLSTNVCTAQECASKNIRGPQEYIQRSSSSEIPVGRPPVLIDKYKNHMIQ